ncbi:uncharacterized protein K02A2.6-like [Anopheles gambiae]|uniref:uncharacterized protein K02A2.6-like n=1 Tax=Anopheles gambiae TaxID=7165 RepID=UPI002AC8E12E|nr:uncharacterized protein K02A2.6-like [Anopheles gambiae]
MPPQEILYKDLRKTLETHFDKQRNKFVESIKFRQIMQQQGESIAQFTLRLKQGAAHCDYGEFLDRMLIEQLLHGLMERGICDEIIAKNPVTFKDTCEIASTLEATHNTAQEVNAGMPFVVSTNKLGYEQPKTKKTPASRATSKPSKSTRRESSQGKPKQGTTNPGMCNGCGGNHLRNQCRFRDARCNTCNKKGHISKMCRSRKTNHDEDSINPVDTRPEASIDYVQTLNALQTTSPSGKKMVEVTIDGHPLHMELDTGAPCGIISEAKLKTIKKQFHLLPSERHFSSYSGHSITCLGRLPVNVAMGSANRKLNVYVVSRTSEPLFGREWIAQFSDQIDINSMFAPNVSVQSVTDTEPSAIQKSKLNDLLENFREVFSDTPGKLIGPPAKVHLKPGATPIFSKAREVPLSLRERYAAEINKKIAAGFYERVDYSEWASPTHIVVKMNGNIRITGNYKPTVNPRMIVDEHPIPKVEDIFNKLKGDAFFCHLDLTDAYTHLPIDDDFKHVLTLNTVTHGLIRPTRAVYGAANIPAIWQRRMESVLQDLNNVVNFYDDIIVAAANFDNLLETLKATLQKLKDNGLRLNRAKCVFAVPSLECLGHKIDRHGLHKSDKHIAAIRDAPRPNTPEELQLFLGKATYYSSFIPNLSTRDRSLRD